MPVTKYDDISSLLEALMRGEIRQGALVYASRATLARMSATQSARLHGLLRTRAIALRESVTREPWLIVDDRDASAPS